MLSIHKDKTFYDITARLPYDARLNSDSLSDIALLTANHQCPFLQANVMLEYTLGDAEALLQKNHSAALKSLAQVEDDLGFLRDQTTTVEVSIL